MRALKKKLEGDGKQDVNDPENHPCEVNAYRQDITVWQPREAPYTGMAAFPIGHIGVCCLCLKPTRAPKIFVDAPKEFTAKVWQELVDYNNQATDFHGKRAAPHYELEWRDGELVNRYRKIVLGASSWQSHGLIRKEFKSADAYAPEQPEFPQ